MGIIKTFGIILLVGGLLLWGAGHLPHLFFHVPATPAASLAAPKPVITSDDGPVTIDGAITLDPHTSPPVPYLVYQRPDGTTRTKELIWAGKRGCETQDGDLPCVADVYGQYPDLSQGESVRVNGTIKGDQILVTNVEQRS